MLAREAKIIRVLAAGADPVQLGGHAGAAAGLGRGLAVVLPNSTLAELRSELGNRLAEDARAFGLGDVGVIVYEQVHRP